MQIQKLSSVVIGSLAAVLFLPSCSSDVEGSNAASTTVLDTEANPWAELPVYGRSLRASVDEVTNTYSEANRDAEAFINECMADKGFPDGGMVLDSGGAGAFTVKARPVSIEEAENRGLYVLAELRDASEWFQNESQDDRRVISFDGDGFSDAQSECLTAEIARSVPSINALSDDYRSAVLGSALLTDAFDAWTECMSSAGFSARSVGELRNEIKNSFQPVLADRAKASGQDLERIDDQILEKETAAATAVVKCDEEVLVPVIGEWSKIETAWLEDNAEAWNELSERDRYAVVPEF